MAKYTLDYREINLASLPEVGSKNASLGELFRNLAGKGLKVPDGFATRARAYWAFLDQSGLRLKLAAWLDSLDVGGFSNLSEVGRNCRAAILAAAFPGEVEESVLAAWRALKARGRPDFSAAVRSSAIAADLPGDGYKGLLESRLNVRGESALLDAVKACFASLFTDRAIRYRALQGCKPMEAAVSVGVQAMVRSDLACAGMAYTRDPESGFRNVVVITGNWGLGGNVGPGSVTPDRFTVFKPSLSGAKQAIIARSLGAKEFTLVYAEDTGRSQGSATRSCETAQANRDVYVLADREAEALGRAALRIEEHFGRPMAIEWAKDGKSGELFIVQAMPDHAPPGRSPDQPEQSGRPGPLELPPRHGSGESGKSPAGGLASPDWEPVRERAATAGAGRDGMPRTRPMLILADPGKAFGLAAEPTDGVGLMRLESVMSDTIRVHPVALAQFDSLPEGPAREAIRRLTRNHFDKRDYFVEKLAEAVGTVAAAFHPRDVFVRLSHFDAGGYSRLLGGEHVEPRAGDPGFGLRGAARYLHPRYREGFRLECLAIRKAREELGLANVKLLLPGCRNAEDVRQAVELMAGYGLKRGGNGFEIHLMLESSGRTDRDPECAGIFDGFAIDGDAGPEPDLEAIARAIRTARRCGCPIGYCATALGGRPGLVRFLVEQGIDSLAFPPDALRKGIASIAEAEKEMSA